MSLFLFFIKGMPFFSFFFNLDLDLLLTPFPSSFSLPNPKTKPTTLFLAGFAMLPWAWALNAWLFYPVAFGSCSGSGNNQNSNSSFIDPVVRRNARRSAAGAAVAGVALLAWASAFSLGGPRAVGKATFERLNLGDLDLDAWGLRF